MKAYGQFSRHPQIASAYPPSTRLSHPTQPPPTATKTGMRRQWLPARAGLRCLHASLSTPPYHTDPCTLTAACAARGVAPLESLLPVDDRASLMAGGWGRVRLLQTRMAGGERVRVSPTDWPASSTHGWAAGRRRIIPPQTTGIGGVAGVWSRVGKA